MTTLKVVRPSGSFSLMLPEGICDQRDGTMSSFWVDGRPLLLQLSSYVRAEGPQATAQQRLAQRIAKHQENWKVWKETIHPDASVEQASAEYLDNKGILWIHVYLVWPHLAVYATISGPEAEVRTADNWATNALTSIRLAVQ